MSKEDQFKEALGEMFAEINGKTMDYSSCRLMENGILELIQEVNKTWEKQVIELSKFICDDCKEKIKFASLGTDA